MNSSVQKTDTDCCGCGFCAAACPVHAIAMKRNREGFLSPEIDGAKCVHCGKCVSVCPFKRDKAETNAERLGPSAVFGARLSDPAKRMESQSGGAFAALARVMFARGGVVYGAAFDETFRFVRHARARNEEELRPMLGSKYVQSDLGGVWDSLRADVAGGLPVLFSGTPCQAAAVRALWKELPDNLILCDLICHSTAAPRVWADWLDALETRRGARIVGARLRDKRITGWRGHRASFEFSDGFKTDDNFFAKLFSAHWLFRPSCSTCPYTTPNRVSDITIGDFWGVENVRREWAEDNTGASFVLVRTERGRALFDAAATALDVFRAELSDSSQAQLNAPVPKSASRGVFWSGYGLFGIRWAKAMLFGRRALLAVKRRLGR